jgi:hypothetical protein
MIPDKNCSTQIRPIANFEYIFQYGGFNKLRQRFMNTDEEGDSYDLYTDTKTSRYLSGSTLEYYFTKETFKVHYSSLLSEQYGLSLENIDNHCYEMDDEVKIQTYFKRTHLLLDHLLNDVENSQDLNVYPESKVVLRKLINFINNKSKRVTEVGVNDNASEYKVAGQNEFLKSTIEDHLEEFKDEINGDGYDRLVDALFDYFTTGKFPVLDSKINFKRINKKRVGWALKELYKSEKIENLDIEYFRFAQGNINLFAKEIIVKDGFNKSNFYKAFTTNPTI